MENSTKTNNDTTTLTFASKIDYTKPSGTYATTLSFKTIPTVTSYYMQDLADPTIANIACRSDVPTIVFDNRDEQAYMIQRLDDGRCWMLDNLNLDLTNRTIVEGMDQTNTNATDTVLGYLRNPNGGRANGDQYPTAGLTFSNWLSPNGSYSAPLLNKSGSCSTTTTSPCSYNGDYTNNTVLSVMTPNSTFGFGSGKIGVLYNYCAASAGSYCYGNNTTSGSSASGNTQYDICPANWRMPASGADGEFMTLCAAINNGTSCGTSKWADATKSSSLQYKISMPLSGHYDSTNYAMNQGNYGVFWTSTYMSNNSIYAPHLHSNVVYMQSGDARYRAQSVRCILK